MIATQTPTLVEILTTQYQMNQYIAHKNVEGVTHEESLVRAAETGNHMNWVIGHVVYARNMTLPGLGQKSIWDEKTMNVYRRGGGEAALSDYLPFEEVVRAFDETGQRIVAGLASLSEEDLAKPAPFNPGSEPLTLGGLLTKSTIHEGYHLGQTGILRRVIGKAGAIK